MSRRGLGALLVAATAAMAQPQPRPSIMDLGRDLTAKFYAGELEALLARATPKLRERIGGAAGLARVRDTLRERAGAEVMLLGEQTASRDGLDVYIRRAAFERETEVVLMWGVDPSGSISTFAVSPKPREAPTEHGDRQTLSSLRLPFQGAWLVLQGGRSRAENYHTIARDQRFACDFSKIVDGARHKGSGRDNADFYAFGAPVLAPAAGVVVRAVDSYSDNIPGDPGHGPALGNHVIIDHGNGEHSVLSQLQKGTVAVREGHKVKAGGIIGRAGNSGQSTEPHLHYHLQDGPVALDATGLPAQFRDYVADGAPVSRGEPRRGQVVAPR